MPKPPSPSLRPLKAALQTLLAAPKPLSPPALLRAQALLLTSGIAADAALLAHFAKHLASAAPASAFLSLLRLQRQCRRPHPHPFNSLISHLALSTNPAAAFRVFALFAAGAGAGAARPDMYTLPVALRACARFAGLAEGCQAHAVAAKAGFSRRLHVKNALVSLYGACGAYGDARKVFDGMRDRDVVSWTGLVSAYVKGGRFGEALRMVGQMDVEPNEVTLAIALVACGRLGDVRAGRSVHGWLLKREQVLGLIVGNAVLDMYVKCERLDSAQQVFDRLVVRDIVSWTAIISGLVQCKRPKEALEVFTAMQASGVVPDKVLLSTVLSACASMGALDCGRWVHDYIERKGVGWDVHLGTAVVDMYAKCGSLDIAISIFHKMRRKNVSSWNALIGGLALHGRGEAALQCFDQMVTTGFHPNEITFITILTACCHSGLVQDGRRFFQLMTELYRLEPWEEHYGCMVDLLGRAGHIEEAYDVIKAMPMRPNIFIWGALLSACQAHGNVDFSQQILSHLCELERFESGVYVLLSNTYAFSDRWRDVKNVRRFVREKSMQKEPGSSAIEVNGKAHAFFVGQKDHPHMDEIWAVLCMLTKEMHFNGLSFE